MKGIRDDEKEGMDEDAKNSFPIEFQHAFYTSVCRYMNKALEMCSSLYRIMSTQTDVEYISLNEWSLSG